MADDIIEMPSRGLVLILILSVMLFGFTVFGIQGAKTTGAAYSDVSLEMSEGGNLAEQCWGSRLNYKRADKGGCFDAIRERFKKCASCCNDNVFCEDYCQQIGYALSDWC